MAQVVVVGAVLAPINLVVLEPLGRAMLVVPDITHSLILMELAVVGQVEWDLV